MEHTDLMFIMGKYSCSSLHSVFSRAAESRPGFSCFAAFWYLESESKKHGHAAYFCYLPSFIHSLHQSRPDLAL